MPRLRVVLVAGLTLALIAALAAAGSVGGPTQSSLGKLGQLISTASNEERVDAVNTPAQDQYGDEGCTPGYWKNHTESWVGYSTGQTLSSVFAIGGSLGSTTLLAALDFGGGNTLDEKKQILLRAAVAALLNAANSGVSYAFDTGTVISQVNAALASNDADVIEGVKDTLDAANNAGCPLN